MKQLFKYILIILFFNFNLILSDYGFNLSSDELLNHEKESINLLITKNIIESQNTSLIDEKIEKFRNQNRIKGLSVAYVNKDKLVFAKGYGYADEEAKIPVTSNHLFRIASVSKLITAIGIMKLVENSKISLDSRVFGKDGILNDPQFLNIKDKRLEKITVRNLLNHSGGWTQNYGDLAFLPKVVSKAVGDALPVTVDSYIKFVTSRKLHFEPGTHSCYSNVGYLILGKVISKVSGMEYEKFIQENVLMPANITDMRLGGSFYEQRLSNEVKYYEPMDSKPEECFDGSGRLLPRIYGGNDLKVLGSAAGWLASAIDLMKIYVVIDKDPVVKDILSPESIDEMTRVNPGGLDPLGWRKTKLDGEWVRTGTLCGTSALIKRQNDGSAWAIISNTSTYKGPRLAMEMDRVIKQIDINRITWPDYNLFTYHQQ
jgi:CubicO group peptidase (beta-lactamase class C family)